MDYSSFSNNGNKIYSEEILNIKQMIAYLKDNLVQAPFNLKKIAQDLALPQAIINEYFDIVREIFGLFKALEQKEQWESMINPSFSRKNGDIIETKNISPSVEDIKDGVPTSGLISEISLSLENLDTLTLFGIISKNQPLHPELLMKQKKFSVLLQKFDLFLKETVKGYVLSDIGAKITQEYESYKRLNSIPNIMEYDGISIRLKK